MRTVMLNRTAGFAGGRGMRGIMTTVVRTQRMCLLVSAALGVAWANSAPAEDLVEPTAVTPAGHEALESYYGSGPHVTHQMLSEPSAPTAGSGLPLPESWTDTFFDPQPRLELRLEAVWLQPDFDNSYPLATQVIARDFDFERTPIGVRGETENIVTPKGTIEYHWNEQGSFEVSGFSMNGPEQTNYALSESDQPLYFDANAVNPLERGYLVNLPVNFPSVATSGRLDWEFNTFGGEMNLWHHMVCMRGVISDLAFGVGGRYLGLTENLTLRVANELDNTSATLGVNSENNLAGPQFLMRLRANGPTRRLRWLAEGKIGLMANSTSYDNTLQVGTAVNQSVSDTQTVFAPLFEGLFACELYLAKNIVVYGGYQLLYMERVDRAGGHFVQDLNAFTQVEEHLGDVFLYGPRVGGLITF